MATRVTIRGQHFSGVGFEQGPTRIHLGPTDGDTNVTDIVLVSDTEIDCTFPDKDPSWPDEVALWITTPLGTTLHAGAFTYVAASPDET